MTTNGAPVSSDSLLHPAARKLLIALAQHAPARFTWGQAATLAGLKPRGGHFNAGRKSLRESGYIEEANNLLSATSGGLKAAGEVPPAARAQSRVRSFTPPRPDRVIRAARNSGPRGSRHGYPLSGQQGLPKEMISRRAGGARDPRDDVQQLERLMTVHQVAKHWQLSPRTVRRMIAQGRLPVLHFGRAVRIHPKVVAKLDSEGIV